MTVPLLILAGFMVVLLAAGIAANSRRKKALAAMAAAKGWQLAKKDRRLPATFGGRPFTAGHRRLARLVMRGTHHGRAVLVIDYEFRTRGGESDDVHHYWVACVEDLPVPLPPVEVVPRGYKDRRVGPGILAGAPEFVRGDSAFDHRYRVSAADHRLAADVLDPKVLRLIASWPDFAWRIEGNRLLTWGKGTVKPEWVDTGLNMLVALAEAVPDGVWRTARG
ncbi:hypothetical protein [Catenulispora pinisilvae]|uniref:hypothetical protein n=1 Tax=Catenulispora pinisilvae TaxID=2705253 RepID=UPI001891889F|nr:hypothetical protein [Catenulispora pinisilvae]